ncbi:MAG: amidase family protein, partial [Acidobacteriota bacterium]
MSNDAPSRRTFNHAVGAAAAGTAIQQLLGPALPPAGAASPQQAAAPGSEICGMSAVELTELLRKKQLSAREVMTAHLAQIERINPRVNAIVTLVADRAMADAAKADEAMAKSGAVGVLHGLPVAHKDLVETAGIRTTYGSPFYRDNVPARDALIVTRIRAAGAITVGKTNTPEFGAGSQTFNTIFGATRNPYDLTRTCGGSSGGAATAVACRMLPIADGSDTGGSLRNPPAFCNVVGLRPSPGRVPNESSSWSPLSVSGPIARSVADVALFLSAIAGADRRSPLSIDEDPARFRAPLGKDFKGVRVAWWRGLGGIPFEAEIRRVVDANRKVFEALGCIVEEAEPDFSDVGEAFPLLRFVANHSRYSALIRQRPEWVKDTMIKYEVEQAERTRGADISRALTRQSQMFEQSRLFFERYAFFMLPVTQVEPFD